MSWTNLKLGGYWQGKWPTSIDVIAPDCEEHISYVPLVPWDGEKYHCIHCGAELHGYQRRCACGQRIYGYEDNVLTDDDPAHAIADRIDASVASEYVELPKDADGETIHVGDVMDGYGKTVEVVEMRYGRSGWALISRDGNVYADTFAFAHHHEPTVEVVLTRMLEQAVGYSDAHTTVAANAIAEYAAKLRLAEGEEQ